MKDLPDTAAWQETDALIDHILTRYHEVHRSELAALQPLARKVETVHADDPEVPTGLAEAFANLARLGGLQAKEEMVLFPGGGRPGIEYSIAVIRADHDEHVETIASIRQLTDDLTPPDHACRCWRALCAGTQKLLDDLSAHIGVDNAVLFQRFE